jgi:hypothetical protein
MKEYDLDKRLIKEQDIRELAYSVSKFLGLTQLQFTTQTKLCFEFSSSKDMAEFEVVLMNSMPKYWLGNIATSYVVNSRTKQFECGPISIVLSVPLKVLDPTYTPTFKAYKIKGD